MPHYVVLVRDHSEGLKAVKADPYALIDLQEAMERWECRVIEAYRLLGDWDQCLIVEAPNNFMAYRSSLAQEFSTTAATEILPAIDLPLFKRLLDQSAETEGPFPWQVRWWARLARVVMYPYAYGRWARRYFTEHRIIGKQRFRGVSGPCIVVANHASHFDQFCLMKAIPWRIRSNLFFGAAADRWFIKGRKEITLRPWYQSLVNGTYPIRRGGGSKTLDYPRWLLDQGANLMLFPEGTRARGRHMSRFKHGVSILALEKGVPVVPVYLGGLRRIRPPGAREATPGPVTAEVLEPIRFAAGTTVPEATEIIYQAMRAAQERWYGLHGQSEGEPRTGAVVQPA
jgi:1-acyl-sn-glycerol-3-phosphate acyltransferase